MPKNGRKKFLHSRTISQSKKSAASLAVTSVNSKDNQPTRNNLIKSRDSSINRWNYASTDKEPLHVHGHRKFLDGSIDMTKDQLGSMFLQEEARSFKRLTNQASPNNSDLRVVSTRPKSKKQKMHGTLVINEE